MNLISSLALVRPQKGPGNVQIKRKFQSDWQWKKLIETFFVVVAVSLKNICLVYFVFELMSQSQEIATLKLKGYIMI